MPRLFLGNFDFERQLVSPGQPSRTLKRLNDELACAWVAVADENDLIWCSETVDEGFLEALAEYGVPRPQFVSRWEYVKQANISELVAWGWSRPMIELAEQLGLHYSGPTAQAVSLANSRRFSVALEEEFGVAIPLAGPVTCLEQLHLRLLEYDSLNRSRSRGTNQQQGWLLKSNYGHAGRERLEGTGIALEQNQLSWISTRLARDGALYFEPRVEICAEAGIQWTLLRKGTPKLDGIIGLASTKTGAYLCSEIDAAGAGSNSWDAALEIQLQLLERLQENGYWGPVGIDAMLYRFTPDESEVRLRPLQDVNARWTMGRLATAWASRLSPGNSGGMWRHGEAPENANVISTSPQAIGGLSVRHKTYWENRGPVVLKGQQKLDKCK